MRYHVAQSHRSFDQLPDSAYVRESDLVTRPRENDPALLPFSKSTLWRHVRAGTFPAPVKLSERVTAWRVGDVRQWLLKFNKSAPVASPGRVRILRK